MYKKYINLGKNAVENEDHETLQELYIELHNTDYRINTAYIFLKLF